MQLHQAKILVVDDNATNRHVLARHFRKRNHEIIELENGKDCLDYVAENDCDLILLDIMMPVMDGITALTELRKTHTLTQLPVIMVTALSDTEHTIQALRAGANDYIVKPFDAEMVLARVQTHLALKQASDQNQEFLSIASHDIKKPLAIIMDIADVMDGDLERLDTDTGDIREMLSLLQRSARTIERHIEDYLDLSIVEHGHLKLKKQDLDFNTLVRECLENNAEYARNKSILLVPELTDGLPVVKVDHDRMMQVIDNLVGNAIKYSPQGRSIRVRTCNYDGSVRFEVIDQGPGIKPRDLDHLFQKHQRTENQPTGGEVSTGLGLAICKQLMNLHSGEIGVHNNDDAGATFWIRLDSKE